MRNYNPAMDAAAQLELAWKNERKWFSRTLIASFISVVCFVATLGAFYWGNAKVSKVVASLGGSISSFTPEQEATFRAQTENALAITSGIFLLLLVSGLLFLFFLVRWILSSIARKKVTKEIERSGGQILR